MKSTVHEHPASDDHEPVSNDPVPTSEKLDQDQPSNEPPTVIRKNNLSKHVPAKQYHQISRHLAHFEIIEPIGAGGMAAVFKATDLSLSRIVALKILPPGTDEDQIERFRQEARAAAKLDHENVARVFFCGEDQGTHFIAFEFVEGFNLREIMETGGGKVPIHQCVSYMLQVATGLKHASARGVIHRDIKPSNIIVTPDGTAKIVDMGLARNLDNRANAHLTHTNTALGTFDYISPEQAMEPRLADIRSDIYSLGCTFYHLLTGFSPVPDGTPAKKLEAHRTLPPTDPRAFTPEIPDDLAAILGRMMAKDPLQRYQHVEHLIQHLSVVARKLGIQPSTDSQVNFPRIEGPLPPAPEISMWWYVAVTLLVGGLFAGFSYLARQDEQKITQDNSWPVYEKGIVQNPNDGQINRSQDPVQPSPPAVGTNATTIQEMLALIKAGVTDIRLTADRYEISAEQLPEIALPENSLRIEGVNSPLIRIHAVANSSNGGSFTLKSAGDILSSVFWRGVIFELTGDNHPTISFNQLDRLSFEECQFIDKRISPTTAAFQVTGSNTPLISLNRCYFGPGHTWLEFQLPVDARVSDCTFAPATNIFQWSKDISKLSQLRMQNCSLMFTQGTLVELGNETPCEIVAGKCLFIGQDRFGPDGAYPVLIHQLGKLAPATRYNAMLNSKNESLPNGYRNIQAFKYQDAVYSFRECLGSYPIVDVESTIPSPWVERDPFSQLLAAPLAGKTAFMPNLRLAAIRVKSNINQELLGSRFFVKDKFYDLPLPTIESATLPTTVKIWQPLLEGSSESWPPNTYASLKMALAAVKPGDTLLIRHNGPLEMDYCEFDLPETDLTIRADSGSRPILIPALMGLKKVSGMFKVYGGKLTLENLHFRMPTDRPPTIAYLPGGGQVVIRDCLISFEEGTQHSVVTLGNPRHEMIVEPVPVARTDFLPKIQFENLFVRGDGRLLHVLGSRPFDLSVNNALLVLSNNVIEIDPLSETTQGKGTIRMKNVTACLASSLLRLRAGAATNMNAMMPGLVKTETNLEDSIFLPARNGTQPLISAEKFNSLETLKEGLQLNLEKSYLGYPVSDYPVLELIPRSSDLGTPLVYAATDFEKLVKLDYSPFIGIEFNTAPPESSRVAAFLAARPTDFLIKSVSANLSTEMFESLGQQRSIPMPYPEE
ncbi:MAG: serine/threonine-protein kinase [Zavarzinella sp.]